MKNWKAIASAIAPELSPEDVARIEGPLNALEAALRPLISKTPHETEPAYVLLVRRDDR